MILTTEKKKSVERRLLIAIVVIGVLWLGARAVYESGVRQGLREGGAIARMFCQCHYPDEGVRKL